MSSRRTLIAAALSLLVAVSDREAPDSTSLERRLVEHHAAWCHQLYRDVAGKARDLEAAVQRFVASPDEAHLSAARDAWIEARRAYGRTEVLRFHDGPIEPLEPLLNAWPVDEAYIDYVEGRPDCGLVQDVEGFPSLRAAVLTLANERGGEANICVGWHAIEFMLWGQDLSADGPGARPATDFRPGAAPHAERRAEYLRTICALLVEHLDELETAWAPERDNYRRRFEAEVGRSVRRMLSGAAVLTAFELGGERLTVAYDTQDQEQEHSCFSDRTNVDFLANQRGLVEVVLGSIVDGEAGPGLVALVAGERPELAAALTASLRRTTESLRAIPDPFDQAMLGDDDSEGRTAIAAAIRALEEQTDVLLILGKELGHDLPLEPGG